MLKRVFFVLTVACIAAAALSAQDALVVNPDGSVDLNGTVKVNDKIVVQNITIIPIPVGSVIAWYKKPGLALPEGFVECNGQTLVDTASPFHNEVIPDMNGATGGTSRFIRGATDATVGQVQEDETKAHQHGQAYGNAYGTERWGVLEHNWMSQYPEAFPSAGLITQGFVPKTSAQITTGNQLSSAAETRPKNIALVWIMRIK